jgi:transcriptional regulator with XRE-family HTH domain
MSEMYDRIEELCRENNITVSQLCREVSITRSCLSELRTGRTESLSARNVSKIAERFGVSVKYLTEGGSRDLDEELKFALWGGAEGITDEMYEEVRQYARMVKLREENKKKEG